MSIASKVIARTDRHTHTHTAKTLPLPHMRQVKNRSITSIRQCLLHRLDQQDHRVAPVPVKVSVNVIHEVNHAWLSSFFINLPLALTTTEHYNIVIVIIYCDV